MVSVLCEFSTVNIRKDTFMKTINFDQCTKFEDHKNDKILKEYNIAKSDCHYCEFDEKTFHRSKEIIEEDFLNDCEIRNISKEASSEYNNIDPQHIICAPNIFIPFIEFILDIYIMAEKQVDLLNNFFYSVFYLLQTKSNAKFMKYVGLAMIFLIMIVQSRKSVLQYNYETLRLFSQYSLVKDFHNGELSLLQEELQLSDMTFVLYYAPWDRESRDLKYHFLKVAAYHHEQISFVAINCWLPGSECRLHYKLQHFPILVLHIRFDASDETLNVPYNGPLNSHHIIRFLSLALRPYIHVSSQADVLAMQLDYQAIVLGYYDVKDDIQDFLIFYYAALSKLQLNHMRDVAYALITNPTLARIFSFAQESSIHLIVWNTTINYPNQIEKNIRNITQFVDRHLSEVARWINISGRKSSSLNNILNEGPFLMIMTQDNPYHSSNDLFRILRSVALEYHNCHNSSLLLWLSKHLNIKARSNIRDSEQICRQYLKSNLQYLSAIHDSFQVGLHEDQHLKMVELNLKEQPCILEEVNFLQTSWNKLLMLIDKKPSVFSNCLKSSKLPDSCQNCSCKTNYEVEMNMLKEEEEEKAKADKLSGKEDFGGPYEDDFVSSLSNWLSEEHCKKLVLGSALSPPLKIKEENHTLTIPGLQCKTNHTLKFIAIDSLLHEDFSTHLGINFTENIPKYTGAVIIDPVAEERYILNQPISRGALVSFIYNFTYNQLTRSKISDESHFHLEDCEESKLCLTNLSANNYEAITHKLGQTTFEYYQAYHEELIESLILVNTYQDACKQITNTFNESLFIVDLQNYKEFLEFSDKLFHTSGPLNDRALHDIEMTYVVLHYTHNCGACSAISHMLLSCMHITSDISTLKFVKIDNSLNTLPWHLTFDVVPTIVMYPAFKKYESRVLDLTSPITIQSLMVLISYGLSPSDRLKLAMKVCGLKCQRLSINRSTTKIRKLQLSINDINMRYQRYIALLVTTKEGLNSDKMSSSLKSKYDLLLNLKYIQNFKLKHLRNKVKHLKSLSSQYPKVPFNFSTFLSYETYMLSQGSKLS